jgi:hypothetical protein
MRTKILIMMAGIAILVTVSCNSKVYEGKEAEPELHEGASADTAMNERVVGGVQDSVGHIIDSVENDNK